MTAKDLKSGITKEWLERAKGVSHATLGFSVWLDEFGKWHERKENGTEVVYDKSEAYTQMRQDAKDDMRIPEYMRINGFWLKIKGLWIAPMIMIGYTNGAASGQVVYSEDADNGDGTKTIYTESLILGEKGAQVHVINTVMNKAEGTRVEEKCWSKFVDL